MSTQQIVKHQQWLVTFQGKTHVINLPPSSPLIVSYDSENGSTLTDSAATTAETDMPALTPSVSSQLLSILAQRVQWPLRYLYINNGTNNCQRYPFVTVLVRSCILGGKGGFGTLLKGQSRQAGAKLTTDFGACRDLQGRRLRHVNDEIKLRKFRDRQRREAAGEKIDIDELYKTPSGIYNWHLMTPTWADISKKAAYKIRRQFQNMAKADQRKADLRKEKDELYQKSMTMYLDETTSTSQSIQIELADSLKQGLLQRQKQLDLKTTTTNNNIKKKRKRYDNDENEADEVKSNENLYNEDGEEQHPNALVSLSGDVVVSDSSAPSSPPLSSSVQMQSKSDFMTAVLVLDGLRNAFSGSDDDAPVTLYYEVTLITGGLAQIGWASLTGGRSMADSSKVAAAEAAASASATNAGGFTPNNDLGDGVGDDAYSFGVDLSRGLKFHGGEDWAFGSNSKWKPGDRLGCSWKKSSGEIAFTLNGQSLDDASNSAAFINKSFQYLFPAFSCNQGEILELHTKRADCKFIPKDSDTFRFVPVGDVLQIETEPKTAARKSPSKSDADSQLTKYSSDPSSKLMEDLDATTNSTAPSISATNPTPPAMAKEAKEPVKPEPLDLSKYNSVQELEELGLDRLKGALLAINVKCGGTLEERAKRLFSLKGLQPKDYPAKLLSHSHKMKKTKSSAHVASVNLLLVIFAGTVFLISLAVPMLSVLALDDASFQKRDSLHIDHDRKWSRQLAGLRGGHGRDETKVSKIMIDSSSLPVSNVTIPLFSHSGSHHVHVYAGSPPQRQILIVDTGSKSMSFPCRCHGCSMIEGHASPVFDPTKSTTHIRSKCGSCHLEGISACSIVDKSCTFSQKYTEGSSWTAIEVEDMVYLGSSNLEELDTYMELAVAYSFGCQTSSNGLFKKQYADGILGLSIHETSLIRAMFEAGILSHYAFSLCLTKDGGYLSIGGVSQRSFKRWLGARMTPISREHGYYSANVTSLVVGSDIVASSTIHKKLLKDLNGNKGAIIDSGTTDTFFPSSLNTVIGPLISDLTDGQVDFSDTTRRMLFSFAEFQKLPTITITFANQVELVLYPHHYMEGVPLSNTGESALLWAGKLSLTNRLYFDEDGGAVFGINALLGNEILFDVQNRQIGFVQSTCSYS